MSTNEDGIKKEENNDNSQQKNVSELTYLNKNNEYMAVPRKTTVCVVRLN